MKILLIDDSNIEQMVIKSFLSNESYEVCVADNGEQGIERYHSFAPDLVLLDVMMPGIDGYEVASRIRELDPQWIPIIFLTGKTESQSLVKGISVGGDDYLTKPIDKLVLTAKMQAMERIAEMRAQLLATTQELETANAELKRLSLSDGLTGLANRRYLDQAIAEEVARSHRQDTCFSILLLDIDYFKKYNDHYGHLGGDDCLKIVASILTAATRRPTDFAARYGGEEFCIVLAGTDIQGAELIAQKIVEHIREKAIPHEGISNDAILTLSIGISCKRASDPFTADDMILRADKGLYQAKQSGRNQYQIA